MLGWVFDRVGLAALALVALISALFAPLAFLGGFYAAMGGMALWGIGMGAQESVLRAAVAQMTPREKRGTAYGVFQAGYGLFWFLGSAAMGILYDVSLPALVLFSVTAQACSAPLFWVVGRKLRSLPKAAPPAG
jgi:MFS family permease